MTDQENYLAAASRIAAGICASTPDMGFPLPSTAAANDLIARVACDLTDRLLARVEQRFSAVDAALPTLGDLRGAFSPGRPISVREDDGQSE